MHYRRFGRSQLMTAEVGIGARALATLDPAQATATFEAAVAQGVTLVEVDVTDQAAHAALAPVLARVRAQLMLVACGDGDETAARAALDRLGATRFDAYLAQGPHPDLGAAQALAFAGLARTVGLTTDSAEQALAAVIEGAIDVVQLPFHPPLPPDDPTLLTGIDAVLNAAYAADIAVLTCSPLAGGRLGSRATEAQREALAFLEAGPPRSIQQGLVAWALSEPRITAVVCGPHSPAQAVECAQASSLAPLPHETLERVIRALQPSSD